MRRHDPPSNNAPTERKTTAVQIDRSLKPELFVEDKNLGLTHLSECYLDTEEAVLAATNGRAMIVVPVTCDAEDVAGYINPEALAAARKHDRGTNVVLTANGRVTVGMDQAGPSFKRLDTEHYKFPPYKRVMTEPEGKPSVSFFVDARQLADAQKALGVQTICVTLWVDNADERVPYNTSREALHITTSKQPGARVLVMPYRPEVHER
jgi:hypothetical protein